MRIVATSDTHFPFTAEKIPDGDVFVHAGDFMYTGYVDEWHTRLKSFEALPHKRKILVPGNHDLHLELYPGPARQELKRIGVEVLGIGSGRSDYHKTTLAPGLEMLGLPYVTGLPLWAFNRKESWIEELLDNIGRCRIVVSHSPPAGILDGGRGNSYGVSAYRKYLRRYQPEHWVCGHIHESYGTDEKEGCKFYNVAMCDSTYSQTNPPVVIDI